MSVETRYHHTPRASERRMCTPCTNSGDDVAPMSRGGGENDDERPLRRSPISIDIDCRLNHPLSVSHPPACM
ncbi:hypothetical protein [uncultured Bifidobacterium sp.]|uniref:hypothetical protein n=1 Tax=uncultured Bifidobacterium sp. TaxID=165187 RepID=UPI0012DECA08|nr:hypothetical protein [uncultured Bifidobacterium sp.]